MTAPAPSAAPVGSTNPIRSVTIWIRSRATPVRNALTSAVSVTSVGLGPGPLEAGILAGFWVRCGFGFGSATGGSPLADREVWTP